MRGFDLTCGSGSSLLMVHVMDPSGPKTWNVQPGGVSADPTSPLFDNQIAAWNRNEAFEYVDDEATLSASATSTVTFDKNTR
jgi:acyl-homoserine lactone acylase PvdQ